MGGTPSSPSCRCDAVRGVGERLGPRAAEAAVADGPVEGGDQVARADLEVDADCRARSSRCPARSAAPGRCRRRGTRCPRRSGPRRRSSRSPRRRTRRAWGEGVVREGHAHRHRVLGAEREVGDGRRRGGRTIGTAAAVVGRRAGGTRRPRRPARPQLRQRPGRRRAAAARAAASWRSGRPRAASPGRGSRQWYGARAGLRQRAVVDGRPPGLPRRGRWPSSRSSPAYGAWPSAAVSSPPRSSRQPSGGAGMAVMIAGDLSSWAARTHRPPRCAVHDVLPPVFVLGVVRSPGSARRGPSGGAGWNRH